MDEYSYENYNNFEQSQHFSVCILDEYDIQQKIEIQYQQVQNEDLKNDKDDIFATGLTCLVPGENPDSSQVEQKKEEIPKKHQKPVRMIRKIQTSSKIEILNKFTFSGSKNDTVELNTNFKTLFKKFIKQNYEKDPENQECFLSEFQRSVSSFKAFSQLYEANPEIKGICSKLIRSSRIIKRIMNGRAKFWMRLQMIKYIEALNRNLQSESFVRWKSIRKQNL